MFKSKESDYIKKHLREWHEHLSGYRIRAEKPHEFAVALLLRPFSKSGYSTDVRHEIPFIAKSDLAPGYHFVGLERRSSRIIPVGISFKYLTILTILLIASATTLILWDPPTILTFITWLVALSVSEEIVRRLWLRYRYRVTHRIRNQKELDAALERVQERYDPRLSFFRASEGIWQTAILEFAEMATVIIADIGDFPTGIEWEMKELVPRFREKFLFYSLNSSFNESSGLALTTPQVIDSTSLDLRFVIDFDRSKESIKAIMPEDTLIQNITTGLDQSFTDRIYVDLVFRRQAYDRVISRKILQQLFANHTCSTDYWSGLEKLSEDKYDEAVERLEAALETSEGGILFLYIAIALADAMTWAGMRRKRYFLLTYLLGYREDHFSNPTTITPEHLTDAGPVRNVLMLSERHPELRLAIWQYLSLLSDGLTTEIKLDYYLKAPYAFLPTTCDELILALNQSANENTVSNTGIEMARGYALWSLQVSEKLKYKAGEMFAHLAAAKAALLLKDKETASKHIELGLSLSRELHNEEREGEFQFLHSVAF